MVSESRPHRVEEPDAQFIGSYREGQSCRRCTNRGVIETPCPHCIVTDRANAVIVTGTSKSTTLES